MGQSAVQPLTEVATSDDPEAASAAGEILQGIVGVRTFVAELSSTDPEARLRAVAVLGVIGGPVAAEALMTMVSDPDVRIRMRSVGLLGGLGDPRAIRVLKRVFTSDPVSEVAAAAEESLRELGALPGDGTTRQGGTAGGDGMNGDAEPPTEPEDPGTFDQ